MIEIGVELQIFLTAVWVGLVVSAIFKTLGGVQRLLKQKKWLICLEDGIYWLWLSWYIFEQIFLATKGVIRWYFVLGIVVGIWSTHTILCCAKKVVNIIKKMLAKEDEKKYY